MGFDVIGLSSEYAVTEQIVAFNPDLVVGAGRGGKVSSLGSRKTAEGDGALARQSRADFSGKLQAQPPRFDSPSCRHGP